MKYIKFMMMALMMCFMNVSYSQIQATSTKTLSKGSLMGMVFTQYWTVTEIINGDTAIIFTMSYQNSQYQHITDIGFVSFIDKQNLLKFCDEVESLANMNIEKGSTLKIEGDGYKLVRMDSMYIYLYDENGKYTPISLNKVKNGFKKIRESAIYLK